jgi:hypothetical protein
MADSDRDYPPTGGKWALIRTATTPSPADSGHVAAVLPARRVSRPVGQIPRHFRQKRRDLRLGHAAVHHVAEQNEDQKTVL